MTINDQPQHLLARYADRTGCERILTWSKAAPAPKHYPPFSAAEEVSNGATIRLVLSEYGMPSHLKPYKDKPRLPGNGYRVPTGEDRCGQPHELWNDEEWMDARQVDVDFSNLSGDYRLPASVLPPDWDKMTREDAPTVATVDTSPHPEIFEAHGLEWYRGNTPPFSTSAPDFWCLHEDDNAKSLEVPQDSSSPAWRKAIGWRPADAPAKLPRPGPQPQDEVQALKARVQALKARVQELEDTVLEMMNNPLQVPQFIHQALNEAGAPRLHPIEPGCELAKPMMPQERIAALAALLDKRHEQAVKAKDRVAELEEKVRVFDDAWASREAEYAAASTPTLRPIAEMPDAVPEGCVRLYARATKRGNWVSQASHHLANHFLDIRLPAPQDPDEELRQEFEAWWESLQTKPPGKDELFIAFRAGRCAHPQGAAA